jgi:hypothetical protein
MGTLDKANDPAVWEILLFVVNCAVILVMTLAFIVFAGGGHLLFLKSILRAFRAARLETTLGESAASQLEASASVITDRENAKARRRMWVGLKIFLLGLLYFVAATAASVLVGK